MKTNSILFALSCAGLLASCGAAAPRELVDAREAYRRASTGPANRVAPAEVHVAYRALAQAERSFEENSDSYETRDLAYVAQRKAQIAEAAASITSDQRTQTRATDDLRETQGQIATKTKQDLNQARTALAASQQSGALVAVQLTAEQNARADADRRAADAQAALARVAAVREEPRGMVITLSGSVLFASNRATLLPEALARLGQVADALLATRERSIIVEGHTDSQGPDGHNRDLSQRRADAVRAYLVQRGYQTDLIQANGLGEGRPIADNASVEGRANNRRVELIVARDPAQASNP